MSETTSRNSPAEPGGPDWTGLLICIVAIFSTIAFDHLGWRLMFLLSQVTLLSVIIWQASDAFAEAAQWIGIAFHLPGSVRGATLDAIASSLPELFIGMIFVLVALGAGDSPEAARQASGDGYGATIATCVGSAVYNMILIPAVCTLAVSMYRTEKPFIEVDAEVLYRDGVWYLACQLVLTVFLLQDAMYWWMGIALLAIYAAYVWQLYRHAVTHRAISMANSDQNDPLPDRTRIVFGFMPVRLNPSTVWSIILAATVVSAIACYFLVDATLATAHYLQVPTFFVAVIVAAAASSVPDTFLSIGSSMRGDDSGAVSNALGSNTFNICVCLSAPLLINSYFLGGAPVSLLDDGKPVAGLTGIRILLIALSFVTFAIFCHQRRLTRTKAYILIALYAVFVAYAVLGSLGIMEL